jgi:hypothetical protein
LNEVALCSPCPMMTYSNTTNATDVNQCLSCPLDKGADPGSTFCSACYFCRGEWDACDPDTEVCSCRPPANRIDGICTPHLDDCVKGYYSNSSSPHCQPCPAGSFSDQDNARACTWCPPGTFIDEEGSTGCIDCPGDGAPGYGSTDCTPTPTYPVVDSTTVGSVLAGYAVFQAVQTYLPSLLYLFGFGV